MGGGGLPPFLSVCLFYLHDISKTDTARITKHDIQMVHDGNPFILSQKIKGKCHESQNNIASMGLCTLLSAGFF